MTYRIVPDQAVLEQVASLPHHALTGYAEVLDVLGITPWNGEPQHEHNPDGAVRQRHFGPDRAGQVVYLILEDLQQVHILLVQWLG